MIDQVDQLVDIANLLRRLMFLEKAVGLLFTPPQLAALRLHRRPRISEMYAKPKDYSLIEPPKDQGGQDRVDEDWMREELGQRQTSQS